MNRIVVSYKYITSSIDKHGYIPLSMEVTLLNVNDMTKSICKTCNTKEMKTYRDSYNNTTWL